MGPTATPSISSSLSTLSLEEDDSPVDPTIGGSTTRLTTGDFYPPARPNGRSWANQPALPPALLADKSRWAQMPPLRLSAPPVRIDMPSSEGPRPHDSFVASHPYAVVRSPFPTVGSLKRLSRAPMGPAVGPVPARPLTPDQRRMSLVTEAHDRGQLPTGNEELALALSVGNAGLFGNLSETRDERTAPVRWTLDVLNNNFDHPAARAAASTANIALRDLVSVGACTALRQLIGHGIGRAQGLDEQAMGYALAVLPLVLQCLGEARDRAKQRNTSLSSASRAGLGLMGAGVLAVTARSGQLAEAAPAMFAFTSYCAMRDVSQRLLQLKDQLHGLDVAATASTGLAYGVNQMGVNSAMSFTASPSGAGTAKLELPNALRRGGINWAGETLDDVVFGSFQAAWQKTPFQVRLSPQMPSCDDLVDAFTRQVAARSAIFMSLVQASTVFAVRTEARLSGEARTNLGNLMGAAALAVLYNLMVNSLNTRTRKSSPVAPDAHPAFNAAGARQDRL